MTRKVYFSFHYERDIRRVAQIRNSWRMIPGNQNQPFMDKADWEELQRGSDKAIEKWIEDQLHGTSVTVVLIGTETSTRDWVLHEIERSFDLGKGLVGIYVHNINDPLTGYDEQGQNPFDDMFFYDEDSGREVCFSEVFDTYDWVDDNGYENIEEWIEEAAENAGR